MKKIFSQAFKEASELLAKEMDRQITRAARQDGWSRSAAKSLGVSYGEGGFNVNIAPGMETMAFDLEYGTETTSPKGTIRKFGKGANHKDRFAVIYTKRLLSIK